MNNKFLSNYMYTGFGLMIFGLLSESQKGWKTVISFIIIQLVLSIVITIINKEDKRWVYGIFY